LHRGLKNRFIELSACETASKGVGVEDVEGCVEDADLGTLAIAANTTSGGGRFGHQAGERIVWDVARKPPERALDPSPRLNGRGAGESSRLGE